VTKLHAVRGEAAPEFEPIAAERRVEGAPMTETRLDYRLDNTIYVGEWAADVGAWRVDYEEWEFCHVLEGVCELTSDAGETQRFHAGDSFVIEPGFVGVWRVIAPMRKRFVVRTS